jgi:uncharacterized protein YkwD
VSKWFKSTCVAVVLIAFAAQTNGDDATQPYQLQLLALHNAVRAAEKLPPLAHDQLLAKAATAHAAHMARTGKFAHDGIGDGTIDSRIDDAGYNWLRAGENIAWSSKGTESDTRLAMKIWLDSPPHRMQLLSDFREVGFARATAADGKVYWVACFGTPQK